jgi:hypothetical protein
MNATGSLKSLLSGNGSKNKYPVFASILQNMTIGVTKSSARGWGYVLENKGVITKDHIDKVETWIGNCVRDGHLPVDFVLHESSRKCLNLTIPTNLTPVEDFGVWVDHADRADDFYKVDWWHEETYYIEMIVEKVDLLNLFAPICADYHIPISNAGGWASRLHRGTFSRRFKEAEYRGLKCVLLYCGDHDPGGLQISDKLRKNIEDLKHCVWTDGETGYHPKDLDIIRFGLNEDFIDANGFPWLNNLVTGKKTKPNDLSDPRHPDHDEAYVQDYIRQFGVRKCEANVLVTNPDAGRQLCRDAIENVLGLDAKTRFDKKRAKVKRYFERWRERSGVDQHIEAIRELVAQENSIMKRSRYK